MFKYYVILLPLLLLTSAGCGNLSPRGNVSPELQQRLDKLQGSQNTLENNQNAIKLELGRLSNSLRIKGDNNETQQGWLNLQADGIVVGVFAFLTIAMLLYFMRQAFQYKQASEIIAEQVKEYNDKGLRETIMAAAWNTNVERTVYKLIE